MAKSMRVNRNKKYSKKRRTNNKATNRKSARREKKRNSRRNNKNLRGGIRGGADEVAALEQKITELEKKIAELNKRPNEKGVKDEITAKDAELKKAQTELAEAQKAAAQATRNNESSGTASAVANPMYGAIQPKEIIEMVGDGYGDMAQEKVQVQPIETLRTGTLVLLGVLIQQLEGEERDENRITRAATELLKHIKFIGTQLEADGTDEVGYGKELFDQLSKVLSSIAAKGSAELGDTKDDTLINLRQAFAILDAKKREEYDEVIKEIKERKKESIYGKSSADLASKIESEAEKARELEIYLEILPNDESTKPKEKESRQEELKTSEAKYVKVTQGTDGKNYIAVIGTCESFKPNNA